MASYTLGETGVDRLKGGLAWTSVRASVSMCRRYVVKNGSHWQARMPAPRRPLAGKDACPTPHADYRKSSISIRSLLLSSNWVYKMVRSSGETAKPNHI